MPVAPGDGNFSKLEVIKACLKGCQYLRKDLVFPFFLYWKYRLSKSPRLETDESFAEVEAREFIKALCKHLFFMKLLSYA